MSLKVKSEFSLAKCLSPQQGPKLPEWLQVETITTILNKMALLFSVYIHTHIYIYICMYVGPLGSIWHASFAAGKSLDLIFQGFHEI